MNKSSDWVRKKVSEDTAFSHLIQFTYHIFANTYVQAFISLIGAIGISNFPNRGLWFWVTIGVYVVATLLIAWANQHIREKIKDTKAFQNSLYGLGAALRTTAVSLQKSARELKQASDNKTHTKQVVANIVAGADSNISFQTVAFTVCASLRERLSKRAEKDDVYITVFQRFNDDPAYANGSCRMIAYSSEYEVTSYGKKYPIFASGKAEYGKIPYHSYVFSKEIKEVTAFCTHEQVGEAFHLHEGCENREKKIQQYICIPIMPAGLGVTFLLQVDTSEKGFFGTSQLAVEDFAKNTIYPYAQLLHMIYEQSRVIEQLIPK